MNLRQTDVQAVFRLIGELCEHGESPDLWMTRLIPWLREMTSASLVVTGIDASQASPKSMDNGRTIRSAFYREGSFGKKNASCRRLRSITAAYELLDALTSGSGDKHRIESVIQCAHPGVKHLVLLARSASQPPFEARATAVVRLLHEELAYLWKREAKKDRLDLPPRLKQTLELLRAGRSEKQVALALGLSRHSVHDHVKRLHKHLGVASRGELLALSTPMAQFAPRLSFPPQRRQNHSKE